MAAVSATPKMPRISGRCWMFSTESGLANYPQFFSYTSSRREIFGNVAQVITDYRSSFCCPTDGVKALKETQFYSIVY